MLSKGIRWRVLFSQFEVPFSILQPTTYSQKVGKLNFYEYFYVNNVFEFIIQHTIHLILLCTYLENGNKLFYTPKSMLHKLKTSTNVLYKCY